MSKQITIAIDGPAAAGKSTVAQLTAHRLNYTYIDTGAMYRSLTLHALNKQISLEDGQALLDALKTINIHFQLIDGEQHVFIDDEDVTRLIRSEDVTNHVTHVAKHLEVRQYMRIEQQNLARHKGVVMDGRDIGTYVLPDAELKIFLMASVEERARRRYKENINKGIHTSLETLTEEIKQRDHMDTHRKIAPLIKAEDAIEIDTTDISIQDVVHKILKLAYEQINLTTT